MKRVLSIMLCLLLVMSMAVTTYADTSDAGNTTVTLTVNGTAPNHTYKAYQIFSGKIDNGVLVDYQWGSGFLSQVDGQTFLDALKANNENIYNSENPEEFTTMAAQLATVTNLDGLIKVMENWGDNLDRIDFFADFLMNGKLGGYLTGSAAETTSTTNTYTFENLQPGYYLIVDATSSNTELEGDFYTKFIISMTDTTQVNVKGDVPSVSKKVSDELDGDYGEAITNQLEKLHYYEWASELPNTIAYYDTYYYEFTDTMSAGLDFNRIEEIYIHTADGKHYIYNANAANPVVEPTLMPDAYPQAPIEGNNEKTITVKWDDLLSKYTIAEGSDKIVIRYSAKLNEYAVVGKDGTDNSVVLHYSNSPNDDSKHGVTPPSDARVYTFGMELTKVDGDTNAPLDGAEFYLYHNHSSIVNGAQQLTPHYAKVTPVTITTGANTTVTENRITEWVTNKEEATKFVSGEDGKISVYGLKDNVEYYLVEETAPEGGYNKLRAPVVYKITGYAVNDTTDMVTSVSYEVNNQPDTVTGDTGVITLEVENKKGTELPSTGGMGTTLIYAAGGILVLAAVVLLVTKKRMANAD